MRVYKHTHTTLRRPRQNSLDRRRGNRVNMDIWSGGNDTWRRAHAFDCASVAEKRDLSVWIYKYGTLKLHQLIFIIKYTKKAKNKLLVYIVLKKKQNKKRPINISKPKRNTSHLNTQNIIAVNRVLKRLRQQPDNPNSHTHAHTWGHIKTMCRFHIKRTTQMCVYVLFNCQSSDKDKLQARSMNSRPNIVMLTHTHTQLNQQQ